MKYLRLLLIALLALVVFCTVALVVVRRQTTVQVEMGELPLEVKRERYALVGELPEDLAQPVGIAFACDPSQGYVAMIAPGRRAIDVTLLKRNEAGAERIATGSFAIGGRPSTIVVKRRRDDLAVELDGRLVAWSPDDGARAGRAGLTQGTPGIPLRVLPLDDIAFSDDFFDASTVPATWQAIRGEWRLDAPKDPLEAKQNGAPMYSRYTAATTDESIAVAGHALWDNYSFSVCCCPGAKGSFGVVFNYQSAESYAALVCDLNRGELICVDRGARSVVAQAGDLGLRPGCWYELRVVSADGTVWAFVNERRLFRVELAAGPTSGRIGLYAQGGGHYFDNVRAESTVAFWQDFGGPLSPRWRVTDEEADLRLRLPASFRVAARLKPKAPPAALLLNNGAGDIYTVRFARGAVEGASAQTASLARTSAIGKSVLATKALESASPIELSFDAQGDAACARANGQLVGKLIGEVGAGCTITTSGRKEPADAFGEVEVLQLHPRPQPPVFETVFAKPPPDMDPPAFWRRRQQVTGSWQIHHGLGASQVLVGRAEGSAGRLWFGAPAPDIAIAAQLKLQPKGSGGVFIGSPTKATYEAILGAGQATLLREGRAVFSAPVNAKDAARLELSRIENVLLLSVDGKRLTRYEDDEPLATEGLGLSVRGPGAVFSSMMISAPTAEFYPFNRPEPDWQPSCGNWILHGGITCIPWTHWITACGEPLALQWWTRPLVGDFEIDLNVSESTEGYANGEHRHLPLHDVLVAVCGDGSSIDRGYVLVLGDRKGAQTLLLRDGQVVARSTQFPVVMAGHCNEPREFNIHVSRIGGRLRITLNGREAFDYTDPTPIPSGRLGLGRRNGRADFSDVLVWERK